MAHQANTSVHFVLIQQTKPPIWKTTSGSTLGRDPSTVTPAQNLSCRKLISKPINVLTLANVPSRAYSVFDNLSRKFTYRLINVQWGISNLWFLYWFQCIFNICVQYIIITARYFFLLFYWYNIAYTVLNQQSTETWYQLTYCTKIFQPLK